MISGRNCSEKRGKGFLRELFFGKNLFVEGNKGEKVKKKKKKKKMLGFGKRA